MVVLVALTAAMYAAVLIPFKLLPIIPGITEIRPANVFPVICSLMFGPAGAWGAAFGNLIGDLMGGTYGLGSYFGMLGNFWFGYIPYRVWRIIGKGEPIPWTTRKLLLFLPVTLLASMACGVQVGWGLDTLGLVPFHVLAPLITMNNFAIAAVLGVLLLPRLYPRVKRWGLLYTDIMDPEDLSTGRVSHVAHIVAWIALGGALVFGVLLSLGVTGSDTFDLVLPGGFELSLSMDWMPQWSESVALGLAPIIVIFIFACVFI